MELQRKSEVTYLPDNIENHLNDLNLSLTKAKALTMIGMETDFSDYDRNVCSDYWDNVFDLLEYIDELKQKIVQNFQELVEQLTENPRALSHRN